MCRFVGQSAHKFETRGTRQTQGEVPRFVPFFFAMFMVLLFKLAVFPFGIFYILGGRKGSVVVLVSCLFIAVAFGQQLNVEIGKVSGPERLSIGLTTVFAILSAVVIVVISTKKHLEDNFDGLPWATSNHPDLCTDSLSATRRPPDQEQPPSESYRINLSTMATDIPKIPCPFTGTQTLAKQIKKNPDRFNMNEEPTSKYQLKPSVFGGTYKQFDNTLCGHAEVKHISMGEFIYQVDI